MHKCCIIAGITLLKHLKTKVFRLKMDFEKKSQIGQGQGLKILTPNHMLSRLPISLAQLNVVNNSKKLKNEIRQLLYSLYRSKNACKTTLWKFEWHY